MDTIESLLDEISKFSRKVLTVADGVSENKISAFEEKYNAILPNDYKVFLKNMNGLNLMGTIVYGIYDEPGRMSLSRAFHIEHVEVENEMPTNLIPFSPDGSGNHYCFDSNTLDESSCKVIFWQYDRSYDEVNTPEIVNDSFLGWAKEVLIEWTLEDFDYNGNKKT